MTILPPVCPLFVPASRPDRFAKAASSGADAVIIDLEDAVAPGDKDAARSAVRDHGIAGLPVFVRVNGANTPWHDDDLAALKDVSLTGIVLPKAEDAEAVARLRRGIGRNVPVFPLIESARGMEFRQSLLAEEGVVCAIFGSLDFALDMGCTADWQALLPARMSLVQTSRALGLPAPIDGVTTNVKDLAQTRHEALVARDHGFGGKLAIHPAQVEPILGAFRPDKDEVAWARRVLDSTANGSDAVTIVDGKMVDAPVIKKARDVLRRAGQPRTT